MLENSLIEKKRNKDIKFTCKNVFHEILRNFLPQWNVCFGNYENLQFKKF